MLENSLKKLQMVRPLVELTGDKDLQILYKFIYERISHPDSYIVFLGETSSGKSSIINSLIGENILPVKASPSTASIAEISFMPGLNVNEYYAINKDATMELLDKRGFVYLAEHPDENLSRLRLCVPAAASIPQGCHIFDTPGYGSIMDKHEEVLKDFLPNSDVVVYTVSYRVGIQDSDFLFLRSLKELVSENAKIILLINRCIEGTNIKDRKILSIRQTVSDLVGDRIYGTILVKNVPSQEGIGHPLPECGTLWKNLNVFLNSEERIHILKNAFDTYIYDLLNSCEKIIGEKYLSAKTDKKSRERIDKAQIESAKRIRKAIDELIKPTFQKLEEELPAKINKAKGLAYSDVVEEIDKSSCFDKEEMVSYTNYHLIPHSISEEMESVTKYVYVTLDELNQKVEDYIQKEIINFRNNIQIILDSHVNVAVSEVLMAVLNNLGRSSLEGYFAVFGGMGGANAGIANAASHLLKKAGDLFGKTFSRETHNALKHFLSKIGATSMKAVGAAIAVITEILFMTYDLATWKGKLQKKVGKGLDKWKDETVPSVIKDLRKLRDENIDTVNVVADKIEKAFAQTESPENAEKWHDALKLCKKVRNDINNVA